MGNGVRARCWRSPLFQATAHAAWLGGPVRLTLWLWAVPAVIAFAVWLPQARYRTLPGPASGAGAVRTRGQAPAGLAG